MKKLAPGPEYVLATPPSAASAPAPFISVIVPVRNEASCIEDTLLRLLHQEYDADRFEILVADGGSTDATREIIAALQEWHPNIVLLDNPGVWSSAGRNVAVRAARGELIVLIDGHCELDNPHYLTDLADAFARSGADCVGRPQPLDIREANRVQRAIAAARASRLGHHPDSHIYSTQEGWVPPQSVAVAYRRDVFDRIGLFDEGFDACEDVEFNHRADRAGCKCFFTPRVQVRYHPRDTLAGLLRQMARYGRGRVRLLRKHPDTFRVRGFLPGAFLAGVLLGPLCAWLWSPLLWVYLVVLTIYALAVAVSATTLSIRARDPLWAALLPLVYLTIHGGAGYGILREALTPRNRNSAPPRPRAVAQRPNRRAA